MGIKVSSPNGIAQLDIHKIEIKCYPFFIPYIKIRAKGTVNLNVYGKEIRFLENYIEYLHNLG